MREIAIISCIEKKFLPFHNSSKANILSVPLIFYQVSLCIGWVLNTSKANVFCSILHTKGKVGGPGPFLPDNSASKVRSFCAGKTLGRLGWKTLTPERMEISLERTAGIPCLFVASPRHILPHGLITHRWSAKHWPCESCKKNSQRVGIKANEANKHPLVLQDWCKDVKMDHIVMNEIMYKLRGYQLPCKDEEWVHYLDAA